MSKLKKLLALLLALAMVFSLMSVLTACSDDEGDDSSNEDEEDEDDKDKDDDEDKDEDDKDDPDKDDDKDDPDKDDDKDDPDKDDDKDDPDKDDDKDDPDKDDDKDDDEPITEPVVVFDHENVAVTFNGVEETRYGYSLNYEIANDSKFDVQVQIVDVTVNGYATGYCAYIDVAAGETVPYEADLSFYLEDSGLKEIYDLTFDVKLSSNDLDEPTTELVSIKVANGKQKHDTSGTTLVDEDGLLLILRDMQIQENQLNLIFYAENHTGADIVLSLENIALNHCICDAYASIYETMRDGERLVDIVTVNYATFIDIIKTSNLENMNAHLDVYDQETYDSIIEMPVSYAFGDEDYRYECDEEGIEIYCDNGITLTLVDVLDDGYSPVLRIDMTSDFDESTEMYLKLCGINGEEISASSFMDASSDILCVFFMSLWQLDGSLTLADIDSLDFELTIYGDKMVEETFTVELN